MICQKCKIPMNTEPNSESGIMEDNLYVTEETKVCKRCGIKVREKYSAEVLVEEDGSFV